MAHIRLVNEIQLDGDVEVVDQRFPVTVTEKKDSLYLVYENEESEKVVLKCLPDELIMTRFSTPATIMRFVSQKEALVQLQTPMGVQSLLTQTDRYEVDKEKQCIELRYALKPLESEQVFACYRLRIEWGEQV